MAWIHQHPQWPHFQWNAADIAEKLGQVRHQQGLLLGKLGTLGFDLQQQASLDALTDEVLNTSAIEGEHYSRPEVRSSLARRLGLEVGGLVPVRRDVEGIVEVMLDATQQYAQPLTAERLFGWHAALFPTGYSGMHRITVGAWRNGPMQVVSGAMGRERVHFEAPAADRLGLEMDAFLTWFEANQKLDLILKAALAHFWFVTIHPFDDGNGRIARAIADLMLARSDRRPERFYSMSTQIERERSVYYRQLEFQQRDTPDLTEWLDWFLGCLGRSLTQTHDTVAAVLFKDRVWRQAQRGPIHERQRLVLNRLLDGFQGHLTTGKYAKLAKCSSDTALRDIDALVQRGVLLKNASGGRSTSYRLNEGL